MLTQKQFLIIPWMFCFGILIASITVQHHYGLAPCPLCMLQRMMMIAILCTLTAWWIHNPKQLAKKCYCSMVSVLSLLGLALAARQTWIQLSPDSAQSSCLPGLSYLFQNMPWGQALKLALHGSTECGSVHWSFMGMSIANWSILSFITILALMIALISTNRICQTTA